MPSATSPHLPSFIPCTIPCRYVALRLLELVVSVDYASLQLLVLDLGADFSFVRYAQHCLVLSFSFLSFSFLSCPILPLFLPYLLTSLFHPLLSPHNLSSCLLFLLLPLPLPLPLSLPPSREQELAVKAPLQWADEFSASTLSPEKRLRVSSIHHCVLLDGCI
jgi:hypothetical protein